MNQETKIILGYLEKFENRVEERFDKLEERMDHMEERMDRMEEHMNKIDEHLAEVDEHLVRLDEHLAEVDEHLTRVDESLSQMDDSIREIRLTIDNELRQGIRLVAEGHLDLYRKLDEAVKSEKEREMIQIRVGVLETEVCKLKKRVDEIA